jgi:transcription elongation factor GreB
VRIVGIDEADLERGEVSWISPIARALLKARLGDEVDLRTPTGLEKIEVIAIEYPDA